MKYMAIIDADEKPVSCEFIGCNGNVTPYLIGATTNIKELEQESILDKIRAEITEIAINGQVDEHTMFIRSGEQVKQIALDIIDKYKAESEE